jgi:hypothetical protein
LFHCSSLNPNARTVDCAFKGGHDDPVTRFESTADQDPIALEAKYIHRLEAEFVFLVDNEYLIGAAEDTSREGHDLSRRPAKDLGFDEHPDSQWGPARIAGARVRILDACDRVDHPGSWIDFAFGPVDLAGPFIGFTGELGSHNDPWMWSVIGTRVAVGQRQIDESQFGIRDR